MTEKNSKSKQDLSNLTRQMKSSIRFVRERVSDELSTQDYNSKYTLGDYFDIMMSTDDGLKLKLFNEVYPLTVFNIPDNNEVIFVLTIDVNDSQKFTFNIPASELVDELVNTIKSDDTTGHNSTTVKLIKSLIETKWDNYEWSKDVDYLNANIVRDNLFPTADEDSFLAYKLFSMKFFEQMSQEMGMHVDCKVEHFTFKDNIFTFVLASKIAYMIEKDGDKISLKDARPISSVEILLNEIEFLNGKDYGKYEIDKWVNLMPYIKVN